MDKILHDPKDPKLWELWYIPYYGSCRILSINRSLRLLGLKTILRAPLKGSIRLLYGSYRGLGFLGFLGCLGFLGFLGFRFKAFGLF